MPRKMQEETGEAHSKYQIADSR